jgi:uncharacterized membrane protein YqjE
MPMAKQATGIFGDLRGILTTSVRAVRTRLELLALELKEEKAWLMRFLIVGIAALYLITFGLMLGVAALVLFAAEQNRPAILGICAGIFLLGGAGAAFYVYLTAKKRHPLFDETIAVLKGDEEGLHKLLKGTGD